MPSEPRYGMDHEHYDWSPITKRRRLRWPDDARVALCVIVTLEHMEWSPPEGSFHLPTLAGGLVPRPFPDYMRFSNREYGHRVGIFRVLDVLDKHGIKATVAMDALTAENYPYLLRHCLERGCEIMGHGVSVSRMITSKMSEQEEREYITSSVSAMKTTTGSTPAGWLSPEQAESSRTPQLLAQAGIRYVCDWGNDDQPYPMKTSQGDLVCLPLTLELDDIHALWDRHAPIENYVEWIKDCFGTLHREGEHNGRVLVLNLHPWLIGQPFRIRHLDDALGYIMGNEGVWAATGGEIVDWYRRNPPG